MEPYLKLGFLVHLLIDDHWEGLINLVFQNLNGSVQKFPVDFAPDGASNNKTVFRGGLMRVPTVAHF